MLQLLWLVATNGLETCRATCSLDQERDPEATLTGALLDTFPYALKRKAHLEEDRVSISEASPAVPAMGQVDAKGNVWFLPRYTPSFTMEHLEAEPDRQAYSTLATIFFVQALALQGIFCVLLQLLLLARRVLERVSQVPKDEEQGKPGQQQQPDADKDARGSESQPRTCDSSLVHSTAVVGSSRDSETSLASLEAKDEASSALAGAPSPAAAVAPAGLPKTGVKSPASSPGSVARPLGAPPEAKSSTALGAKAVNEEDWLAMCCTVAEQGSEVESDSEEGKAVEPVAQAFG